MEKLKELSNDEPILVVKKRFSRGWILIITCLVFAFCLYRFAQNPEVDKIDVIVAYFGFGLFLFGAIGVAYKAILFKKGDADAWNCDSCHNRMPAGELC